MLPLPLRIFVADDHPALRRSVRGLLELQDGWQVVGEASNGAEALLQVAALQPDVVLLDINLPGLDGLEAAVRIRQAHPQTRVLILSANSAPFLVSAALAAGAHGYVSKADAPRELLAAVAAVASHNTYLSSTLLQPPRDPPSPRNVVSDEGRKITEVSSTASHPEAVSEKRSDDEMCLDPHRGHQRGWSNFSRVGAAWNLTPARRRREAGFRTGRSLGHPTP